MNFTVKYKTNINCNGCIAAVTPSLNGSDAIEKWEVDITNPEKILTVELKDNNPEVVKELVQKAGYRIEEL